MLNLQFRNVMTEVSKLSRLVSLALDDGYLDRDNSSRASGFTI